MFSRWDFKHFLAAGYVDIIQPDPSHAGGISETRKIAAMAEAYDVALAPHCPLGPIALAACLQIDAVCHNAFIQEQSLGIHYNQGSDLLDYLLDPSRIRLQGRLRGDPAGAGARDRDRRGRSWPSGRDRPPLAQPGLAARGRQLRRMVSGSRPVRVQRPTSVAGAAPRMTRAIIKCCPVSITLLRSRRLGVPSAPIRGRICWISGVRALYPTRSRGCFCAFDSS